MTLESTPIATPLGLLLLGGGFLGALIAKSGGFDRNGWFRRMTKDDFWDWFDAPWVGGGNVRRIAYVLSVIEIITGLGMLLLARVS